MAVAQLDARPSQARRHRGPRLPSWRREALRTTLWIVPAALVVLVVGLFVFTYLLDQAAHHGRLTLPSWIRTESADAGRQVLIGIAAAVITVVGVVFSITILALTLASQQFGPRMLRNFVRDIGTQFTLGVFVATFVYALLALGSITSGPKSEFVPSISITTALVLVLGDLIVLIYFIHHVATVIQLPEVIADIARDLNRAIDDEFPESATNAVEMASDDSDPARRELIAHLDAEGVAVPATTSGYLQFVGYGQLVTIAQDADAVIRLVHRTGHFVMAGHLLATVWPPHAAPTVARALARAHVTGPHRTLIQDPVFAIDQLVEIAIRAISPAVNDPFTAITCIDWLADGLSKISERVLAEGVYRDPTGRLRLIEFGPSYARMVDRAFDKIRQSGRGMPAVVIRQVDAIGWIMEHTVSTEQRRILLRQADMLLRASDEAIPEAEDRSVVRGRYQQVIAISARLDADQAARAPDP
jgi:uncharacterized membrane protein